MADPAAVLADLDHRITQEEAALAQSTDDILIVAALGDRETATAMVNAQVQRQAALDLLKRQRDAIARLDAAGG